MPASANSPAPRSVIGMPAFTGGPSGSPVTDMMPRHALRDEVEAARGGIGPGLAEARDEA